ncbi:CBM35 domain-containing protein [Promicromonospora sp. Populi]|uniref:CBM35 domain-containing protein n=1 Tax=Promicromonospora sp. Populi TaxID=3239420 RepID=UPI0034E2CDC7
MPRRTWSDTRTFPAWRRRLALLAALAVAGGALVTASALPAGAATTRYEAEQASRSGGAVVATEHTGYSGSGFVGGYTDGNKGAATTTFTVTASTSGPHTLALRYANGTGSAKTLTLLVDGAAQQVTLQPTASWSTWATQNAVVTLSAGSHSVGYRFGTADSGNVNLDSLDVTDSGGASGADYGPGPTFEAEAATLAGGAVVATDHTGFSGSGFVGGYTDANAGSASTTFKVQVAAAGAKDLTVRYANGTGSARTLSLYDGGTRLAQLSLPATASWDAWSTVTHTATLTAGNHDLRLAYDSGDNGNANIDKLDVTANVPPQPAGPGEAESAYRSGGAVVGTATGGFTGSGYVGGFTGAGARLLRTVQVDAAGSATATFVFSGGARTLDLLVNGRVTGQVAFPAGSGWRTVTASVPVRAGVNTVGVRAAGAGGDVLIDSLVVSSESELAARGASASYKQYEAEAGATNGTRLTPSRTYGTVQAESSGRSAVRLDAVGENVGVTLTAPASGVVVRYSIPDNAAGTGLTSPLAIYAGSTKLKDVTLSSAHSWVYGAYPYFNDPALGSAHRFYDELRFDLPEQPAGTVLRLQKDSSAVGHIDIDLVEAERIAPALSAPSGAVSITSHGATPGGGDDTSAITAAVAAAKAAGVPVWIPAGTFHVNTAIQVSGVTVLGAGPWHSVIAGTGRAGGFYGTGGGVTIADVAIFGSATVRDDANDQAAIEGDFASETLLQNIWMQHTKVGLWVRPGSRDVFAVGLRVRDTYADGINFRSGVANSQVTQSTFRNTGDDSLAMWSDGAAVTGCVFAFNTVQAPALANGLAVYGGGGGNRVEDNLVADTVNAAAGIAISTRFGVPFTGTTTVQRNTLTRTGSREPNWPAELGALWVYADVHAIDAPIVIRDMTIVDSTYAGLLMSWEKSIQQVSFDRVAITGSGTYGIELHAAGSATFANTTVSGSGTAGLLNDTGFVLNRLGGNSGF